MVCRSLTPRAESRKVVLTCDGHTLASTDAITGTIVTVTTGSLNLAPIDVTVSANEVTYVTATTAALSLAPIDASVTVGENINVVVTTAALSLAPIDVSVNAETSIIVTTAALSLSPVDATVTVGLNVNVTATTASLSLSPVDATVNAATFVSVTTAALSLSPVDASINAETNVVATTAALSLAPVDATITAGAVDTLAFHAPLTSSLTLSTGAYTPTFTRATAATVVDDDGVVRDVATGCARFKGARSAYNWITNPEDFSSGWTATAGLTHGQTDPYGGSAAVKIAYTSNYQYLKQNVSAPSALRHTNTSVWLKSEDATGVIFLYGSTSGTHKVALNLTSTWKRYNLQIIYNGSDKEISILMRPESGTPALPFNIYAAFPQYEATEIDVYVPPSEYIGPSGYSGAGSDTSGFFAYDNAITVTSNVVDETSNPGSAIAAATLDGVLIEEQRTNYANNADDLTGGADTIDLTAGSTGDFTLSVSSDAAVTVAAGTATGTGFGQATAGTPVTFNLSVTGTVTLTLDSGTLTQNVNGSYEYNLEKGSFATSWIPNTGAGTTRNADVLTYDYQPSSTDGSMVMTTTPLVAANDAVALGHNSTCLYMTGTPRESDDGTNQVVYGNPTVNTETNYGLTWEDGGTPETATYKDGSQVNTGSLDAGFDPSTDELGIGCQGSDGSSQQSATYKEIKIYTDVKDQTFMEGETT